MRSAVGALLLFVCSAAPAAAQIQAPELPTGGIFGRRSTPDPNVVTQELTVTFATGSGYDRNILATEDGLPNDLFGPQQTGQVSFGAVDLNYRWGRATRFIQATGRGYTSYATAGIEQVWNTNSTFRAATDLGRRFQLSGDAGFDVAPQYLFRATEFTSSEQQSAPDPGIGLQPRGVTEQKWFGQFGALSLRVRLGARQDGDIRYENSARHPLEGSGLESRTHIVAAAHNWRPARDLAIRSEYRFRDGEQSAEKAGKDQLETHSATLGIQGQRRLSATRTITYTLAGGVTRADAHYFQGIPAELTFPSFSAGLGVPLTRSWMLSVSAAREATVLEGYAPEVFVAEAGSVEIGGNLSRRVQMRVTAYYATGNSRSGAAAFDTASGSVQSQVALTRRLAVFGAYGYYDHLLRNLIVVQPGFPDRYRRHSVWAGTTVWLPVFGRF